MNYILGLLIILTLVGCGQNPLPTSQPTVTVTQVTLTEIPPIKPTVVTEMPASSPTLPPPPIPTNEPTEAILPTVVLPTATMNLPVPAELTVNLQLVADGFTSPLSLADANDGSSRLFVADQTGLIYIVTTDGQRLEPPLLDLRDRMFPIEPDYDERGLLGFALHPDFATPNSPNAGRFFVHYSAPLTSQFDFDHIGRISSFRISSSNPNLADPFSEQVVLELLQPQFNHNGGQLAFGLDGYLYIGSGDGGNQYDTGFGHSSIGNGQDRNTLLGKILRLDVNDPSVAYQIPDDNPFGQSQSLAEIYALGFRNPFRFSFDEQYGLLVGDVGQNLYEEVNIVVKGGNYGWNRREGQHCFSPDTPDQPPANCDLVGPFGDGLIDPILEYAHPAGQSVIGGYVYRGEDAPSLLGRYIFGDWFYRSDGLNLFTAVPTTDGKWVSSPLQVNNSPYAYILSFGEDANGSLYLMTTDWLGPTSNTGKVYRIVE